MSVLKTFRQHQREKQFFGRAQARAQTLSEHDVVDQIDLTIMSASRSISYYRHAVDRDMQFDQLAEVRMNLEAALGMLETVLPS